MRSAATKPNAVSQSKEICLCPLLGFAELSPTYELDNLRSAAQWHIGNLLNRLDYLRDDPWADYSNRQRITRAMWQKVGWEDV